MLSEKSNKWSGFKVLVVSEPNKDGVFIHVRGLLDHMIRRGLRIVYAYSDKRSSSQLFNLLESLSLSDVAAFNLKVGSKPCFMDLIGLVRILWKSTICRPAVIHGHSSKAGGLVRLAAMLAPGPAYLYTPHAYYSMAGRPAGPAILYWLAERIMGPFAKTINISKDERGFACRNLHLNPRASIVAPNPVSLDNFQPASLDEKIRLREQFGIPNGVLVFGIVARFSDQKDLDTFYRAAIDCALRVKNVHFLHLGAGGEIDYYKKLIHEAGVAGDFTHFEYMSDTSPIYRCMDAFVLTSKFEAGWPIVMLEALSSGLPVVTTDFVGIGANDIEELSHVSVVQVGDVFGLSKVFCDLAGLGADCMNFNNHRKYVETHFSPAVCYDKVLSLYHSLTITPQVV